MKNSHAVAIATLLATSAASQAQLVISDNYNAVNVGSGFVLGEGVNSDINPPATRLTGSAADGLRYINRALKVDTAYFIGGDARLRVNAGAQSGRITLSADGSTPFDFGSALGIANATPANPVQYDVTLSMDNNASGTHRFSFALATEENNANFWDFGLQLYKADAADDYYTVGKRIDTGSSGLVADLNAPMFTMAPGTAGTEVSFLIRVTDAGAESSAFNSRVQVSQDGGVTWSYDTLSDPSLSNGWRLDGAGRFFSWDVAGGNSSFVTYDDLSVTVITPSVPEPATFALGLLGGFFLLFSNRRQ